MPFCVCLSSLGEQESRKQIQTAPNERGNAFPMYFICPFTCVYLFVVCVCERDRGRHTHTHTERDCSCDEITLPVM